VGSGHFYHITRQRLLLRVCERASVHRNGLTDTNSNPTAKLRFQSRTDLRSTMAQSSSFAEMRDALLLTTTTSSKQRSIDREREREFSRLSRYPSNLPTVVGERELY